MHHYFPLGSTPCDEPCACVGEEEYAESAQQECRRFMDLLRTTFGPEPAGARLHVKAFLHDFGPYYEVVCDFDDDIPASVEYALRCEDNLPATWEG